MNYAFIEADNRLNWGVFSCLDFNEKSNFLSTHDECEWWNVTMNTLHETLYKRAG